MSSRHRWLSGAFAILVGVAGALACGAASRSTSSRLPKAGAPGDDGTGLLARWSRGGGGDGYGGAEVGGAGTGGDAYGYYVAGNAYYGGDEYGGGAYGGASYAPGTEFAPAYVPAPSPMEGYSPLPTREVGAIEGVVRWRSPPRAAATIGPFEGSRCPARPNPTLERSASGGVGRTLVYLADIRTGKGGAPLGGTIEHRSCSFAPHIQIAAPIGVVVSISNLDPTGREIRLRNLDAKDEEQRASVATMRVKDLPLLKAGIYEVTAEESGAVGWVVVPRHPYYAITDRTGRFRLDDVPPGEYTLVAWHEPVATGVDAKGRLIRGNPVEVRTRVRVHDAQISQLDVSLP
jgi:hypothetical protein